MSGEGKQSCVWIVIARDDNAVNRAILSTEMLKETVKPASVAAFVYESIAEERMRKLHSVFDMVFLGDSNLDLSFRLMSIIKAEKMPKVVTLKVGAVPIFRVNYLFEDDDKLNTEAHRLANKAGVLDNDGDILANRSAENLLNQLVEEGLVKLKEIWTFLNGNTAWTSNMIDWICHKGIIGTENETFVNQILMELETRAALKHKCIETPTINDINLSNSIAIVGMACRLPQADSVNEYWEILKNGWNTSSAPPPHRLSLVDMNPKLRANFLKCPINQFDAAFFQMSPSEASFTDPQTRLMLEVSWEAFEDAGINPENLRGTRTGVFHGSWLQDYKEALNIYSATSPPEKFIRKYFGNGFGSAGAKLSYFYGFTGPNISTESGCSSSMIAVDMAMQSLQRGGCSFALSCGTNLILNFGKQTNIWSEDGLSKTFDKAADGYGRAEGIAVLLMKRYSDAVRDKDNIHGIIRGSATTQEGLTTSFGAPTVESESLVMKCALEAAKLTPSQVDFVEAHATGTAIGDQVEAAAIAMAYSGGERKRPLWIGSGKTNIGHTESCSGMAGIIKVLLSMKHSTIPKHINLTGITPEVDFSKIPGAIPLISVPWPSREDGPKFAGVSSFGITGTDVHMILQEPPQTLPSKCIVPRGGNTNTFHLLTLSAKSELALEQLASKFGTYLEVSQDQVENITYTANVCRPHHHYRLAVMGRDNKEMAAKIKAGEIVSMQNFSLNKQQNYGKICFTFPGKIGKGDLTPFQHLYKTVPHFKEIMDQCDGIFRNVTCSQTSLASILLSSGSNVKLTNTEFYTLFPSCQYSLAKLWMHYGVQPLSVMGYCMGELSAALVSEALTLEDFYKQVNIMEHFSSCQKRSSAEMIAIEASRAFVEQIILNFRHTCTINDEQWIEITGDNSANQTVVAAPSEMMACFKFFCKEQGVRCKSVSLPIAMHSRVLEPACQASMEIFSQLTFHPFKIPFISSATGALITDQEFNAVHLYKMFRNCANFRQACQSVKKLQLGNIFIEIGPNAGLTKWTMENLSVEPIGSAYVCVPTFSNVNHLGILDAVATLYTTGINFDWYEIYQGHLYKRVLLPNYPFQRKSFWYERRAKPHNILHGAETPKQAVASPSLHPLLGITLDESAGSKNIVTFQSNLASGLDKTCRFICDHVIGTKVVFPGACFLEMILSAWRHSTKNLSSSSVVAKNFKIFAPLVLDDMASQMLIQCVVNKDSGEVSIFSKRSLHLPWKMHCTAEIAERVERDAYPSSSNVNFLEEFGRAIECSESVDGATSLLNKFYADAAKYGLNFGPTMKPLKHFRVNQVGDVLVEVEISKALCNSDFICNPVLFEAMLQLFMIQAKTHSERDGLRVPVLISEFSLFLRRLEKVADATQGWYVSWKKENQSVFLFQKNGLLVASMDRADFVATSVALVEKAGEHEDVCLAEEEVVKLYDVIWQEAEFYIADTLEMPPCSNVEHVSSFEVESKLNAMNPFCSEEATLDQAINRLCSLYVVKAMHELDYNMNTKLDNLEIVPHLTRAFAHYISYFEHSPSTPERGNVEFEIQEILNMKYVQEYDAINIIKACGSNLAGVLKGTVNPHRILFDEKNLAENYYRTSRFAKSVIPMLKVVSHLITSSICKNSVIRILEVGAGTGAFTKKVVELLNEMEVHFEYHYTDISPTLVAKATDQFSEWELTSKFVFKTLDIEQDAPSQGFPPDYFDVVVAYDVLHATRDLNEAVQNIGILTKVGGSLLIGETEKPIREFDICFGILDAYWHFEDEIRNGHCTISSEKWLQVLAANGFAGEPLRVLSCGGCKSVISARKTSRPAMNLNSSRDWLLLQFSEKSIQEFIQYFQDSTGRRVQLIVLNPNCETSQTSDKIIETVEGYGSSLEGIIVWMLEEPKNEMKTLPAYSRHFLEPLLHLCKNLLKSKPNSMPKFHVITEGCWSHIPTEALSSQGPISSQVWGFLRTLRNELPHVISKSIDMAVGSSTPEVVRQVLTEMWLDDNEVEVGYSNTVRYLRRLKEKGDVLSRGIQIPEATEYSVKLPESRNIYDLEFVAKPTTDKACLDKHQVKVEIRSVSLNFKDVLTVMKPSKEFEHSTAIGLDFSGVVTAVGTKCVKWKKGDSVFGICLEGGCLASHVIVGEDWLIDIPAEMTFADAATLPIVFLTVWHCFVNVAKLKTGQTALVHAASGGVGLVAIQLAKKLGISIIATAGSGRKRRYLRALGIQHVFSSRTCEFADKIKKLTGGQGVDMVLNCLTGPDFVEASLSVCREGSHFVEISKMGVWTKEQVKERKPSVKYDIVDLTKIGTPVGQGMMSELKLLVKQNKIIPLSHVTFPARRLVDALTYLQKGKHIGKVIIDMPRLMDGVQTEQMFNDRSTYLITGGKGAIGFAVCRWMIGQGAKYFVLVGRDEAKNEIRKEIKQLEEKSGAVIICKQLDISDFAQCKKLILQEIAEEYRIPPLRGVHHCAGTLSDKLIENQDWANFERVLKPKVDGAWNLHLLTREMDLEHFVLYSSEAAIFGHTGQSNYASANVYLDCLAQFRQSINLPALSVNWGQWKAGLAENVKSNMYQPFSVEQGLLTLEYLMKNQYQIKNTVLAGNYDFEQILRNMPHYRNSFLQDMIKSRRCTDDKSTVASQNCEMSDCKLALFDNYKELTNNDEKNGYARQFVLTKLCENLGTSENEIGDNTEFSDMGMDSLMRIEFENQIYAELGNFIGENVSGLKRNYFDSEENGTLEKFTQLVCSVLDGYCN